MFSDKVKILGRKFEEDGRILLKDSYSGISFNCKGSVRLTITPLVNSDKDSCPYVGVVIDGNIDKLVKIAITNELKNEEVVRGDGNLHKVEIVKLTEEQYGNIYFSELNFDDEGSVTKTKYSNKSILFIGDSITAGYGVDGVDGEGEFTTFEENVLNSAAVITANKIGAEAFIFASSGNGIISKWIEPEKDEANNEGLIPEIFPFDKDRFPKPDYICVNLGTNDNSFIKNKEDRTILFKKEYIKFLVKLRRLYPTSKMFIAYGIMAVDLMPAFRELMEKYIDEYRDDNCVFVPLTMQSQSEGLGAAGHPSLAVNKRVSESLVKVILENG